LKNSLDNRPKLSQQLIEFLCEKLGKKVSISGDFNRLQACFDTDTTSSRFWTH